MDVIGCKLETTRGCFFCGKVTPDLQTCMTCQKIKFCSEEHQNLHRFSKSQSKKNKSNQTSSEEYHCFPYSLHSEPGQGRFVRAIRDIEPGEVVLVDVAAVAGPLLTQKPLCLECHKQLRPSIEENANKCLKCGFPLCKEKSCQNGNWHSKFECKIFSQNMEKFKTDEDRSEIYNSTGFVTALRVLLLSKNSEDRESWQRVSALMDHQEERKHNHETWQSQEQMVVVPIKELNGLSSDISSDEIQKFIGILRTNGSRLESPPGYGKGLGLFPTYSMLNHSCIYNAITKKKFVNGDHYLKLVAIKFIPEGSEISSHYVSSVSGTFRRQSQLQKKWYFTCKCPRCLDPTEFGTMCNALKCQLTLNCKGSLLPADPVDLNSRWLCNICSTTDNNLTEKNSLSSEIVGQIYENMDRDIKLIENVVEDEQEKICRLMELLNRSAHETFHSNNGCLNEIREKLIMLLQSEASRLKSQAQDEKERPTQQQLFSKMSKIKLQQLTLVIQLTEVMKKVDPSPNLEIILKKVGAELKESIAMARRQ